MDWRWIGRLSGRLGRNGGGLGCRGVGTVHDQIHHDIAFEPHHLAAVGNPEPVGAQCSVEQFDVDMFFRRHRALADIDQRLRQPGFVPAGGLQEDVLAQVQQLRLGVEQPAAGIERDVGGAVFHQNLGAQRPEIDAVRIGQVLGRGFGPDFVGSLIRRVAGHMRQFHRDLGAGNHQVSDVDRQLRQQHAERIIDRDKDDRRHRQDHGGRHRDTQHPHHPAVARRDRKAGIHSGLIGWVLNRIHHCSKALGTQAILPGIARFCSPTLATSVTETGRPAAA